MMKNTFFRKASIAIAMVAVLGIATAFGAPTRAPVNPVSQDFSQVAEMAIPAVVSIKVELGVGNALGQHPQGGYDQQYPSEFFGPEFYRFFGQPAPQPKQAQLAQGSGFFVSPEGHILTNNHLVEKAERIVVTLNDGTERPAKVVGTDPNTDVAVIKIEGNGLPFLKLADSSKLRIGQWAIAIGTPMGLQASLSVGVVSATGRNNLSLTQIEDFIQTDAAINRGSSGGPLLDINGQVIGMNTAIATNTGGYMGICFAIPSNVATLVMDQIMSNGIVNHGFLGVSLQRVDTDLATAFGLDRAEGALIADVLPESPAAKAGLKQGDIIISYNGTHVDNIGAVRNAVSMMNPGSKVTLQVNRDGKMRTIQVEVGGHPTLNATTGRALGQKLGLEVQDLTPEVAQRLGYVNDAGVIVSRVAGGSAASLAGIKQGTLVLKINHQPIHSVGDFEAGLQRMNKGEPVLLLVKQGSLIRFVSLRAE